MKLQPPRAEATKLATTLGLFCRRGFGGHGILNVADRERFSHIEWGSSLPSNTWSPAPERVHKRRRVPSISSQEM